MRTAHCPSKFTVRGSAARTNAADRRGDWISKRAAAGEVLSVEERAALKRYEARKTARDAAYEAWKSEGAVIEAKLKADAEARRTPERLREDAAAERFRAAREAAVARGLADPSSAPDWVKDEILRRSREVAVIARGES